MLRSLLLAYAVTVILLLLLALLLYKLELDEGKISIGIIAVYVLSCFVGGLAAGKASQSRKFIWGLLVGALYFLVLAVVSIASGQGGVPSSRWRRQVHCVQAEECLGGCWHKRRHPLENVVDF